MIWSRHLSWAAGWLHASRVFSLSLTWRSVIGRRAYRSSSVFALGVLSFFVSRRIFCGTRYGMYVLFRCFTCLDCFREKKACARFSTDSARRHKVLGLASYERVCSSHSFSWCFRLPAPGSLGRYRCSAVLVCVRYRHFFGVAVLVHLSPSSNHTSSYCT